MFGGSRATQVIRFLDRQNNKERAMISTADKTENPKSQFTLPGAVFWSRILFPTTQFSGEYTYSDDNLSELKVVFVHLFF